MRWALLLTAPALVLTVIPPVITIPQESYEDGFLTTVGLLWMLLILWAIASAPDLVRWAQRRRLERPLAAVSKRELVVTAACLVTLVAVTRPAVVHARTAISDAAYTAEAAKLASPPLGGRGIQEWAFAGSLPPGWQQFDGVTLSANGNGVRIDSARSTDDDEVSSPTVTLPPGHYTVATAGIVERGGIGVGVFDLGARQWLATSRYWSGQSFANRVMVTRFALKKTTQAEITLTNWSPSEARPARWTITDVRLLMDAS
jgi:hypothetical protein